MPASGFNTAGTALELILIAPHLAGLISPGVVAITASEWAGWASGYGRGDRRVSPYGAGVGMDGIVDISGDIDLSNWHL